MVSKLGSILKQRSDYLTWQLSLPFVRAHSSVRPSLSRDPATVTGRKRKVQWNKGKTQLNSQLHQLLYTPLRVVLNDLHELFRCRALHQQSAGISSCSRHLQRFLGTPCGRDSWSWKSPLTGSMSFERRVYISLLRKCDLCYVHVVSKIEE